MFGLPSHSLVWGNDPCGGSAVTEVQRHWVSESSTLEDLYIKQSSHFHPLNNVLRRQVKHDRTDQCSGFAFWHEWTMWLVSQNKGSTKSPFFTQILKKGKERHCAKVVWLSHPFRCSYSTRKRRKTLSQDCLAVWILIAQFCYKFPVCMIWEWIHRFKYIFFRFYFCIGLTLLYHNFGGELSSINFY